MEGSISGPEIPGPMLLIIFFKKISIGANKEGIKLR